uniref:Uncharacterized protein n=1 Tax=Echinococcus granulosus TaxID=6210 RepID=A0A068WPH3_ECHGR|nr:hypothetical protein EgrG_000258000 [Echinococcus granulosus]
MRMVLGDTFVRSGMPMESTVCVQHQANMASEKKG